MRRKHIVVAAIAFLLLARSGVLYDESKDPWVPRWGVSSPKGSWRPLGLFTLGP